MDGGECIKTTDWPSTVQNENDPTKQTHHDNLLRHATCR